MATEKVKQQMSKTERQTLIRLVRQRFKLLEVGLHARRTQLEAKLREQVREERRAEVEAFRQRYRDEVVPKVREAQDLLQAIRDDATKAGLAFGNTSWVGRTLEDALRGGDPTFEPQELNKEVQRRLSAAIGDRPMSAYALELEESSLIEELLVGDLSSDAAGEFLARVPTLEGLIPLANGNGAPELTQGDGS